MKKYIFINVLNSNIEISILAYNYSQAMDLLLSVTRNIDEMVAEFRKHLENTFNKK